MRSKFTFNHLTLLSALFISSVAIWYSVAGLASIFAASKIPVIIMGASLEVGKLVVAVWLHRNWHTAARWLKTYLSTAVVVLMFITSMGIFGYLSKSHVEQTAQSEESIAQVERINAEIARNKAIIARAEEKIKKYEEGGSGVDAAINAQIDREQQRINTAYDRVKPVIQTQLDIIAREEKKIENRVKPYENEIVQIDKDLKAVEDALAKGNIRKAQRLIGVDDDGSYGKETIAALKAFRTKKEKRRKWLLWKIDQIKKAPNQTIINAQEEIKRIRASVQEEIAESNATIKKLRARLGKQKKDDVESLIATELAKIKKANEELDRLTQEKYRLQASYRKLQAEVGPIKYIAEFIYGENADQNLLEKSVRWVIIMIIFVFDPLAVLLLIAAQYSFEKDQKLRFNNDEKNKISEEIPNIIEKTEEVFCETEEVEKIKPKESNNDTSKEVEKIEEIKPKESNNDTSKEENTPKPNEDISLVKVSENYVNYNGKVYRIKALQDAVPELNLDFNKEVKSGNAFPISARRGMLFLNTSTEPTQLYIFNGTRWNQIDKNLLTYNAYSHEYIKTLIKKIGNGEYNPELLNDHEKKHIEELLRK